MARKVQPWYSYKGKKYAGDSPPFYDLEGVNWYDKLTSDLPAIREQVLKFIKKDGLNIQEYFNTTLVEGARWEALAFMFWGLRNEEVIDKGKDVFKYFNDIPGIVSLMASILQPGTRIKGHHGDTDAIYRIHIPIFIPAQLPACGLKVGGITKPWAGDELIPFCDAHFHEAWNMTDKPRIIMIVDVVKEEFLPQTNNICANVLSYLKYQRVSLKHKFIKRLPGSAKDILRRMLKLYPDDMFGK